MENIFNVDEIIFGEKLENTDYFQRKAVYGNNGIEKDHKLIWLEPSKCINGLFFKHQSWATAKAMNIKGLDL